MIRKHFDKTLETIKKNKLLFTLLCFLELVFFAGLIIIQAGILYPSAETVKEANLMLAEKFKDKTPTELLQIEKELMNDEKFENALKELVKYGIYAITSTLLWILLLQTVIWSLLHKILKKTYELLKVLKYTAVWLLILVAAQILLSYIKLFQNSAIPLIPFKILDIFQIIILLLVIYLAITNLSTLKTIKQTIELCKEKKTLMHYAVFTGLILLFTLNIIWISKNFSQDTTIVVFIIIFVPLFSLIKLYFALAINSEKSLSD